MNNTFAKEVQKIRKSQTLLTIFVLLFLCMIVWGTVSLFSVKQESKLDKQTLELAKSLNPTIETGAFGKLQAYRSFSDTELANFPIYQLLTDEKSKQDVVVPIGITKKDLTEQRQAQPTPSPASAVATPTPILIN